MCRFLLGLAVHLLAGQEGCSHQPQLPLLPALLHLLNVTSKQSFQRGNQLGHRGEVSKANLKGKTEVEDCSEGLGGGKS